MEESRYSNLAEAQILQSLPQSFDFYGMGKVEAQETEVSTEAEPGEGKVGVAFSVFPMLDAEDPKFRTLLLTVFDDGMETEMYSEIGNIIASRFATGVSKALSEDITITPPLLLKTPAVQRLTRMKKQTLTVKRYVHAHEQKLIPIEVYVLKVEGDQAAHA
jgi:hypothetical protein